MSNFICCCGMREGTNTNNCERCLLVARINQLYEQRQQLEAESERLRGVIAAILSCIEKDGWKDDIIEQCHMLALEAHNK